MRRQTYEKGDKKLQAIEKPNEKIYDAFAEYVQAEQEHFYRVAYSYVKDRDAALDIIQNAIYKGLKGIHSLNEPQYIRTWFYRILINACIDEFRRAKRTVVTDPSEIPEEIAPEGVERAELMDLQNALDALEPETKAIITLRVFEDMKLSDIAEITQMNLSTVKGKLYRGLAQLKMDLKGGVFGDE